MLASRAMALFALNICELRCRIQRLEPPFFKANHMTTNALIIELLIPFLECRHRVGMPRVCPHLILFFVTTSAGFDSDEGRVAATQ